jgi:hypothetical protein
MVTHLFARLDPKPVKLDKEKEQQEQTENEKGGAIFTAFEQAMPCAQLRSSCCVVRTCWQAGTCRLTRAALYADLDAVLQAFPPDKQQDALQEIQTRITNVMFVELLFEKGPREAEMINREYHWQPAVVRKMADMGYQDSVRQGKVLQIALIFNFALPPECTLLVEGSWLGVLAVLFRQ